MTDWFRKRPTMTLPRFTPAVESAKGSRSDTGEYRLLNKYLRDRYANRVVLTFKEIEDLIGFALPEKAWLLQEWWGDTNSTPQRSAQADAWTLANMTCTANLAAKIVVFERQS